MADQDIHLSPKECLTHAFTALNLPATDVALDLRTTAFRALALHHIFATTTLRSLPMPNLQEVHDFATEAAESFCTKYAKELWPGRLDGDQGLERRSLEEKLQGYFVPLLQLPALSAESVLVEGLKHGGFADVGLVEKVAGVLVDLTPRIVGCDDEMVAEGLRNVMNNLLIDSDEGTEEEEDDNEESDKHAEDAEVADWTEEKAAQVDGEQGPEARKDEDGGKAECGEEWAFISSCTCQVPVNGGLCGASLPDHGELFKHQQEVHEMDELFVGHTESET